MRRLALVLAVLVVAWLAACAYLFVWPAAETGPPRHADAIVMLAGQRDRLATAEAVARQGIAPLLVLSSVSSTRSWRAATRLCDAGRYGRVRVLCFDAHPYSTRGEARTVARLARAHGWRSVVVVSSTYHLTRARILFRRCWSGRLSFVGAPTSWWWLPYDWASETAKLVYQETIQRSC